MGSAGGGLCRGWFCFESFVCYQSTGGWRRAAQGWFVFYE